MKFILSILVVFCFCLSLGAQETSLGAQETDSVMLEKVLQLKSDVSKLKTGQNNLNSKIITSNKNQDVALEETRTAVSENQQAIQAANTKISELNQLVEANKNQTDEERETLAAWVKQMLMIMGIIFLVLFAILLVLIITNRSRINREYVKLEAKVDNTREDIQVKIRDVLKKHEDDLAALKASVDKGKK